MTFVDAFDASVGTFVTGFVLAICYFLAATFVSVSVCRVKNPNPGHRAYSFTLLMFAVSMGLGSWVHLNAHIENRVSDFSYMLWRVAMLTQIVAGTMLAASWLSIALLRVPYYSGNGCPTCRASMLFSRSPPPRSGNECAETINFFAFLLLLCAAIASFVYVMHNKDPYVVVAVVGYMIPYIIQGISVVIVFVRLWETLRYRRALFAMAIYGAVSTILAGLSMGVAYTLGDACRLRKGCPLPDEFSHNAILHLGLMLALLCQVYAALACADAVADGYLGRKEVRVSAEDAEEGVPLRTYADDAQDPANEPPEERKGTKLYADPLGADTEEEPDSETVSV
jgi:hypothetical protein